ncbi:MAG TPA: DegT/DnrJ/EryC1/StrS family aminotransferase [Chloroflexota bacterium]|nr:DegT/DnrJ/EryC1/StrS family aminotransferase [Chloroflexota bacterium]
MRVPFVDLKAQYATINNEIVKEVMTVLKGMNLLLGPNVTAFETEFAAYCQTQYAIGVGSGTDALHLALRACGVRAGDEVITVSHSFIATAEAIVMVGATPVYVDIDPHTYTMDPAQIEAAISERTRAIVPVHLYGQMADMDAIMAIARHHGLAVVEDACQAAGASDHGRKAGGIGDAAAFSFSPTANLGAYGDGGAVTTNSRAIAEEVRRLRSHGLLAEDECEEMGVNSRLDELQAAILRVKLRHLDRWNDLRRLHAETYRQLLSDSRKLRLPHTRSGASHVYRHYVVQIEDRDYVRQSLGALGIESGVHYPIPIHLQKASEAIGRTVGMLPETLRISQHILSLPMYAELEPEHLSYVAACLRTVTGLERSKLRVNFG